MKDNISNIKSLLSRIKSISNKYEELEKLKGENFNVFQIFDMESDENKMHSRFIETLLNPNGPHGLGSIFLELFFAEINFSKYFTNLNNVNTRVEHPIGKVNLDTSDVTGGRIDIYIWDNEKSLSIENKINAGDQIKQIERYVNYNKSKNQVFYLTLDGKEPSKSSKGKLKSNLESETPDFYCLSYSETIINWLYKCQKEAADLPIIRETIKQYIIAIKRLTGQLTNQKMEKEIIEYLSSTSENLDIARKISKIYNKVQLKSYETILNMIISELNNHETLKYSKISRDRSTRIDGIFIPLINLKGYDIGINLELQNSYFFFCASRNNKNRSTAINTKKDLDKISIFLNDTFKNKRRTSWTLCGTFSIFEKFTENLKFETNQNQRAFAKSTAKSICNIIDQSKIMSYSKSEMI